MRADVLRRHEREPVARQPCVCVDKRQRTRRCKEMCASIACFGLHIRHLRVPVPAFPDSYLLGVDRIPESRTVYL
jgi:hypothetical protein